MTMFFKGLLMFVSAFAVAALIIYLAYQVTGYILFGVEELVYRIKYRK